MWSTLHLLGFLICDSEIQSYSGTCVCTFRILCVAFIIMCISWYRISEFREKCLMDRLFWTILFSFRNSCQFKKKHLQLLKVVSGERFVTLTSSMRTMKIRERSLILYFSEVCLSLTRAQEQEQLIATKESALSSSTLSTSCNIVE